VLLGDKVEKDEIAYGKQGNAYKILIVKPKRKHCYAYI